MTKREKRLADLRRKIARLERDRALGIKLLVKAEMELPGLLKRHGRLAAKLAGLPLPDAGVVQDPLPAPASHVAEDRSGPVDVAAPVENYASAEVLTSQADDGLAIPGYLDRTGTHDTRPFNPYADQHKAAKQEKARVRIAKMKAKATVKEAEITGKTRKWPLTGRDAERALKR